VALHTSDLASRARGRRHEYTGGWVYSQEPSTVLDTAETTISRGAPQASSRKGTKEGEVGRGHRTKPVALNRTSSCEAVVPFGFGEPKLFADSVGVELGEAVSANSAPLSSCCGSSRYRWLKEVDVALVVAKSTGDSDSNLLRGS